MPVDARKCAYTPTSRKRLAITRREQEKRTRRKFDDLNQIAQASGPMEQSKQAMPAIDQQSSHAAQNWQINKLVIFITIAQIGIVIYKTTIFRALKFRSSVGTPHPKNR